MPNVPSPEKSAIIGRFAPSPTGPLHLGSLVAAVGSYLMAKRANGRWLLRMEDLDAPRVIPGCADDMLRTLEAFGFEWDGPVVYQSGRTDAYAAALELLLEQGLAYPCGCSRAEIARISSAPHGSEGLVYPGICRGGLAEGKVPRAIRVRVDERIVSFRDGIMGLCSQQLMAECGDFVVRRADGPFAYHLAVVVDDGECGVNQVVRGADLLDSTPRQIYLQELLGITTPDYFHLPLVTGPHGGKLSKRDNLVSLAVRPESLHDSGRLLSAALRFLGNPPPVEVATASCRNILDWAVAHFDPSLIPAQSRPLSLSIY